MNEEIILVFPTIEYEQQAKELIEETIRLDNDNLDKWAGFSRLQEFDDYKEWIISLINELDKNKLAPGRVCATTYFSVRKSDNKIVGIINIRHELNDYLYNFGGHIGYSIRPTERRKGYGNKQLSLALDKCNNLDIKKVLITCRENNIGSAKTIESCNGKLENIVFNANEDDNFKRYWIELSKTNYNDVNYTLRKYNDTDYEFVYEIKKNAYQKYVEENWGKWDDVEQHSHFEKFIELYKNNTYIIQVNNEDIGFYNDEYLEDGIYEIGNICILPKHQGKGIGTKILKDKIEENKNYDIIIQYFKQNPVGNLYKRLGFVEYKEKPYHYQLIKRK